MQSSLSVLFVALFLHMIGLVLVLVPPPHFAEHTLHLFHANTFSLHLLPGGEVGLRVGDRVRGGGHACGLHGLASWALGQFLLHGLGHLTSFRRLVALPPPQDRVQEVQSLHECICLHGHGLLLHARSSCSTFDKAVGVHLPFSRTWRVRIFQPLPHFSLQRDQLVHDETLQGGVGAGGLVGGAVVGFGVGGTVEHGGMLHLFVSVVRKNFRQSMLLLRVTTLRLRFWIPSHSFEQGVQDDHSSALHPGDGQNFDSAHLRLSISFLAQGDLQPRCCTVNFL